MCSSRVFLQAGGEAGGVLLVMFLRPSSMILRARQGLLNLDKLNELEIEVFIFTFIFLSRRIFFSSIYSIFTFFLMFKFMIPCHSDSFFTINFFMWALDFASFDLTYHQSMENVQEFYPSLFPFFHPPPFTSSIAYQLFSKFSPKFYAYFYFCQ